MTAKSYEQVIENLFDIESSDLPCSETAAQVLLNLYNRYHYHTDLMALSDFNNELLLDALSAVHLRIKLRTEPHEVIKNGPVRFKELARRWSDDLKISNRYRHDVEAAYDD